MKRFVKYLPICLCDEQGATAIEYAFIASLISIVAISSMYSIGDSVENMLGSAAAGFNHGKQ
jgi:Flp pilus assembly pilin Flp